MQERRKAAELAAQNQALSQHLVETTASFREALQLVETLLGGAPPYLPGHVLPRRVYCSWCRHPWPASLGTPKVFVAQAHHPWWSL